MTNAFTGKKSSGLTHFQIVIFACIHFEYQVRAKKIFHTKLIY